MVWILRRQIGSAAYVTVEPIEEMMPVEQMPSFVQFSLAKESPKAKIFRANELTH
jgi:hypothetical protein